MNFNSLEVIQDTTFKYDAFFHKALGLWPDDDYFLANFSRLRGYVMAAITVGSCIFQFTALAEVTNSDDVPEAIIEGMAALIPMVKTVPLVYYRNNFIDLMQMTREINVFSTLTEEEKTIYFDWQNIQDKLVKFLSRSYLSSIVALYFVAPMFRDSLPFQGVVPDILRMTPWYQITYVVQCLMLLSNLFSCISSDSFSITFMCQLCKQLELVQCSIRDLSCQSKSNLADTINRHAVALDYGQKICDNLTTMYLLQHIFISMFLCFAGIIVLSSENSLILIKMIVISGIFVFTLLIICYVGETITSASLRIASATESSNYESFLDDVSALKAVSFILCRAQKPLRMTVAQSGSMNLRFFTETMNKLVSAFMILRTMVE